jgi:hypothetical protein
VHEDEVVVLGEADVHLEAADALVVTVLAAFDGVFIELEARAAMGDDTDAVVETGGGLGGGEVAGYQGEKGEEGEAEHAGKEGVRWMPEKNVVGGGVESGELEMR